MNFVKKHPLLTAFLIPFFICIIICIGNGVYPFGDYLPFAYGFVSPVSAFL